MSHPHARPAATIDLRPVTGVRLRMGGTEGPLAVTRSEVVLHLLASTTGVAGEPGLGGRQGDGCPGVAPVAACSGGGCLGGGCLVVGLCGCCLGVDTCRAIHRNFMSSLDSPGLRTYVRLMNTTSAPTAIANSAARTDRPINDDRARFSGPSRSCPDRATATSCGSTTRDVARSDPRPALLAAAGQRYQQEVERVDDVRGVLLAEVGQRYRPGGDRSGIDRAGGDRRGVDRAGCDRPGVARSGGVVAGGSGVGGGLRGAAARARRAVGEVLALGVDPGSGGGELGALLDLLGVLDAGYAAAVAICDRIESGAIVEDRMGLSLEGLLAFRSRMTFGDRRTLINVAEALRGMPHLTVAFRAGVVGWAQVRAIVLETRGLSVDARAEIDARFDDLDAVGRMDADQLIGVVGDDAARLRPDLAAARELRTIESRFLHIQPALDGALTGYFELDPEAGATFLEGLETVSDQPAPPTGTFTNPPSHTTEKPDMGAVTDSQDAHDAQDAEGGGVPQWADPVVGRSRARQRADGLVRLAELALGAHPDGGGGRFRRARVRMHVVADIATLVGDDRAAKAARLLWQTVGSPPALTPGAVRRLASDADLRFLVTDGGRVLGVSRPTPSIPANVRAAVQTRDQGCRFPGCQIPVWWTDLHHVVARQDAGPTTIDNLVALCRKHHVLVTQGRWRLVMTRDAVVTVTRGRHTATSDPPAQRQKLPTPAGPSHVPTLTGHQPRAPN